jgi:cytochrome c-type biogenesis protein CcmF
VGPPYFDVAFMIPALPLVLLVGIGMHSAWRSDSFQRLSAKLRWVFATALVAGLVVPLIYGRFGILIALGVFSAAWLMLSALIEPAKRLFSKRGLLSMPRGMLGMSLAHFGVGMFVLGVAVTSAYSIETDIGMQPGESVNIAGYQFEFAGTRHVDGPNYQAEEGTINVTRGGDEVTTLYPQKRVYRVQQNPMTEAGIDGRLRRDLFVALGEPLGNNAWSMRIQYKPMIRLIWLGCLIMSLGGLIALSDPRYRRVRAEEKRPATGTQESPA